MKMAVNVASAKTHAEITNVQSTANVRLTSAIKVVKLSSFLSAASSRNLDSVRDWNNSQQHAILNAMTTPTVEETTSAALLDAQQSATHQPMKQSERQRDTHTIARLSHRHSRRFPKKICNLSQEKVESLPSDASPQVSHHHRSLGRRADLR